MNHISANKTFSTTYLRNLTLLIFIAIIGGIATGYFFPEIGRTFSNLSFYFFKVLEILILPVIFLAIIYGISGLSRINKAGQVIFQTLLYFLVITTIAILLGFAFAFIIQPGKNTNIELSQIQNSLPKAFNQQDDGSLFATLYLNRHVLFLLIAVGLGTLFYFSSGKRKITHALEKCLNFFNQLIKYIYFILPVIIFCNISYSISVYGIAALLPLSKVLATVYLTCFVFIFGVLGFVTRIFGFNLWSFLLTLKEEILLVMATSTSKTAFPMIFEKLTAKGYDSHVHSFVIPLGYCFNLAGACIYLSISCIYLVQFYDIQLDYTDYIWLFVIISFTSKTASGVPGSGFLALIFTLSRFGKIPMTDLALLYSVDRFMNEARSITNFIGIAVSGAVIAKINQQNLNNTIKQL